MKKLLFLALSFLSFSLSAQTWEWGKSYVAPGSVGISNSVADGFGNLYVLGTVFETGVFETSALDSGTYVSKFQPDGTFLWAKNINGGTDVTFDVDFNNEIVISGNFSDSVTFDSFSVYSLGGTDVFALKLDSNGTGLWLRSFGGINFETAKNMVAGGTDIYITGTFIQNTSFGSFNLTDTSSNLQFIAKLDSNGNCVWLTKSSFANSKASDIAIGENGRVYCAGIVQCSSSYSYCTQYVLKFSSAGSLILTRTMLTTYSFADLVCRDDQIYISKDNCPPGACSSYLTKYDTAMNQKWTRFVGGSYSDYWCSGFKIGPDYSIYSWGMMAYYDETIDSVSFNGIWVPVRHDLANSLFLAKMDSTGFFSSVSGFYFLTSSSMYSNCVTVDNSGDYYTVGTVLFADSISMGNYNVYSQQDVYIGKISEPDIVSSINIYTPKPLIEIFPNPSSGIFTVKLNDQNAKVCVRDVMGRCVLQKDLERDNCEVNLSGQSKGVYFMEVMAEGKRKVKKIVIQ